MRNRKASAGLLALWTGMLAAADKPAILAVFGHPDDEQMVSGALARYAKAGHPVYLAIITSGQKGVRPHAGIPAGEALARVREQESRCACKEMGIREPFLLGFQDQGISTAAEMDQVVARLREIFDRVKPAVVITWGPDGLSGHPDHRAASNLATQVFQQQSALGHKPSRLYYVAIPESRFLPPPPGWAERPPRTVADVWVTTEIDARAEHEAARRALDCHKTQFDAESFQRMHLLRDKILDGRVFLRLALGTVRAGRARERDLFEGLK